MQPVGSARVWHVGSLRGAFGRGKRQRIDERLIGRRGRGPRGCRIEQARGRLRQPQPQPFVREKEESFVFDDGTAESPAEIVLAERARLGAAVAGQNSCGRRKFVPQVVKCRAMESIDVPIW